MAGIQLDSGQYEALLKMKNGCILKGGVGSGKSRTSLAYYYYIHGGRLNTSSYIRMIKPCDLYIITTARKRDTLEWEEELTLYKMCTDPKLNLYQNKIVIDSWNNIKKYINVKNAFFIFDEQRAVGYGSWAKTFIHIAKSNKWILLSATPGDKWIDYVPVFVANGFYRNKTDFIQQHVVFSSFTNYPKISRYLNEGKLLKLRDSILIKLEFARKTIPHHEIVICDYDRYNYEYVTKNRWNLYSNMPIKNANEFCLCLRRLVNSDQSRQLNILDIVEKHKKLLYSTTTITN